MTATLTTSTSSQQINGINATALRDTIDAVNDNTLLGASSWRVNSAWVGGTRSDHHVEGVAIGGEFFKRPFTLKVDEPEALCGTNQFANPQEYLLASLNACMMVGYVALATLMGIRLTRLEVEVSGDIDLRGFLGIDPNVKSGYADLKQTVRIAGDGTKEQFERIHNTVKATSPNFFNITSRCRAHSLLSR
jgi:uncharacterized OsmC-like protein